MDLHPLTIKPPLRGVHRSSDLETQIPLTCYDALNVVPVDATTGRARVGVSPGWASYGTQNDANLIETLNVISATSTSHARLLLTATGGTLYKWAGETPTSVGTNIDTGRHVHAAPYLQNLYIANVTNAHRVYDHGAGTLGNWTASAGTVPADCHIICEWANRIVMAGNPAHVWFMSRIGDPDDWEFAADDAGSPVSATDVTGGQIGEPITALIPHNHDCLLISSANTIAVVKGNPVDGGIFERVSNVTGVTNSTAWCRTANDHVYMMTRKGLAVMPPGCGDVPTLVSNDVIPESLKTIDGINRLAYLAYDVLNDMVHIHVTGGTPEYWLYSVKYKGFWPRTAPGVSILAMARHDPIEDQDKSGVLVGTSTGLKRLDRTADLGGSDEAYVKMPVRLSNTLGEKVLIQRALANFGSNTTDTDGLVDYYAAADMETAIAEPLGRHFQAKIRSHLNGKSVHPRLSGQSGMVTITQVDTAEHWSFEEATLYLRPFGKER